MHIIAISSARSQQLNGGSDKTILYASIRLIIKL